MSDPETNSPVVADSIQYFRDGLYCSEAILKAFNEHYKLGLSDEYRKIATGFGAGLGGAKCSCGSLTGGAMVLSLVYGRVEPSESELEAFNAIFELHNDFKKEFKATCCRTLTKKLAWGEPEHHVFCERFVKYAAEKTEALLQTRPQLQKSAG